MSNPQPQKNALLRQITSFYVVIPTCIVAWFFVNLWISPPTKMVPTKPVEAPIKHPALPDFATIVDVKAKKAAFFAYLQPIIQTENERVFALRQKIQRMQAKKRLSENEITYLAQLAQQYKVPITLTSTPTKTPATLSSTTAEPTTHQWGTSHFDALLTHIDIVPASMGLAQAANESAWGSSRFAKEANNLFGQWCFKKGCGVVPKARDQGKSHEVAKFASVQASVGAYIHNINSSHAYDTLRQLRKKLRQDKQPIAGITLVNGLKRYSERGEEYIKEIRAMIRLNKLTPYDIY